MDNADNSKPIISEQELVELPTDQQPIVCTNTADQLIEIGIKSDIPVESLQKLMELREKELARVAKQAFVKAMAGFQSECPTIIKDSGTKFKSKKTQKDVSYSWASLSQIVETIKEPLQKYGLAYRFQIESLDNNCQRVTCFVTHIEGHTESTSMVGGPEDSGTKNTIQSYGSTVSYLQRYTLIASLGLTSADEDNDGESAEVETITEEECKQLEATCGDYDVNLERFKEHFDIEKMSDMPKARLAEAYTLIKSPKRQHRDEAGHEPTTSND